MWQQCEELCPIFSIQLEGTEGDSGQTAIHWLQVTFSYLLPP